jgi:beta-xylosidase
VFRVDDGPQEADGYQWWHLVAPYDENRAGWAVVNYLSPLPKPAISPTP